jgi:glycosyltransferase involved in cell wall biosynthesis
MRVLHIIGSGTIGGAEGFVLQLARHQRQKGRVSPELLFATGGGPLTERATEEGMPAHLFGGGKGVSALTQAVGLMKGFDVLHFHGLYPLQFLAATLSGVPVIYQVHGLRALTKSVATVLQGAVPRPGGFRLPTSRGAERFLRRQWLRLFLKAKARAIVAPSDYFGGFFSGLYGIGRERIQVVRLGVAPEKLTAHRSAQEVRKEFGLEGAAVVGCVSTFRPVKRIDRLIDGFAELRARLKEERLRLLVVGDGEKRAELESRVGALGLSSQVIIAGLRQDVADLLQVMDVFVLPSERESFSLALAEALHAGIPVFAFAGSRGAEELVRLSGGGKVVSTPEQLASEVATLLRDSGRRRALGAKGKDFAGKTLTMERTAAELEDLYSLPAEKEHQS